MTCDLDTRPVTPEYVLSVFQDWHRQSAACGYADSYFTLTFESTIADWRGALDLLPWKQFAAMDPDREYLAFASFLPLQRFAATPKMMRLASAVLLLVTASAAAAQSPSRDWRPEDRLVIGIMEGRLVAVVDELAEDLLLQPEIELSLATAQRGEDAGLEAGEPIHRDLELTTARLA
jgi:hypothetical protein